MEDNLVAAKLQLSAHEVEKLDTLTAPSALDPEWMQEILNLLTIGVLTQTQVSSPQKSYNIKWEKLPGDFQLPDDPDATDLVTWLEQRQA